MKFASEILILLMLIMSNGRVFVTKKAKVDALVMLSPLAFLLAGLHLFAFSVDAFSLVILFLSFLVLLSNFHALFRYSSRLIVDRYSPLMKSCAVITVALSLLVLVTDIVFKPMEINSEKLKITETKTALSGNFIGGFTEAEKFSVADGLLYEFAQKNTGTLSDSEPVIIFMSDKRGDTQHYKPYLQFLAESGYRCYAADFYAKDGKWVHSFADARITRRMALVLLSLINNQKFLSQREFYTYNYSREYNALINILDKKFGTEQKYIFITDEMGYTAACDIQKQKPEKIAGIFDISKIDLYKTKGYGFIQETDPMLAFFLDAEKDKSWFNVKYIVLKTDEYIKGLK